MYGLYGLPGRVTATDCMQLGVDHRLYAHAYAVDSGLSPCFQAWPVDVLGIGLDSKFGGGKGTENPGHTAELSRRENGRGAAAEIDGVDRKGREFVATVIELAGECADETVGECGSGARIEVAVGALGVAEGYVDVDSGHNAVNTVARCVRTGSGRGKMRSARPRCTE